MLGAIRVGPPSSGIGYGNKGFVDLTQRLGADQRRTMNATTAVNRPRVVVVSGGWEQAIG